MSSGGGNSGGGNSGGGNSGGDNSGGGNSGGGEGSGRGERSGQRDGGEVTRSNSDIIEPLGYVISDDICTGGKYGKC